MEGLTRSSNAATVCVQLHKLVESADMSRP